MTGTGPQFPSPYGTWYSRYAHLYVEVPPAPLSGSEVTQLPLLPRLVAAA